jgi:hypothetical protein
VKPDEGRAEREPPPSFLAPCGGDIHALAAQHRPGPTLLNPWYSSEPWNNIRGLLAGRLTLVRLLPIG